MEKQEPGQSTTNVNEVDREDYLNEVIEEAAPLRIVGSTSKGYCIIFGKYRMTEIRKTEQEARADIENEKWTIIINLIAAMTGKTDEALDKFKNKN